MTFLHFLNCSAVAFGPSIIICNAKLVEVSETWQRFVRPVRMYIAAQLVKMLLMATFLDVVGGGGEGDDYDGSDVNTEDGVVVSLVQEVLKAIISGVDVFAIFYLLSSGRASVNKDLKIWFTGVGWALGSNILSNLLYFWNGARSREFDWKYLTRAVEANLDSFVVLGLTAAVSQLVGSSKGIAAAAAEAMKRNPGPAVIAAVANYLFLPLTVTIALIAMPFGDGDAQHGISIAVHAVAALLAAGLWKHFSSTSPASRGKKSS